MKQEYPLCPHGHTLSPDNLYDKKAQWNRVDGTVGMTIRKVCRECFRGWQRKTQQRIRAKNGAVTVSRASMTFEQRLAGMLEKGKRELDKARQEGVIK